MLTSISCGRIPINVPAFASMFTGRPKVTRPYPKVPLAKAADWPRLKLRIEVRGSKTTEPYVREEAARRNHWYHRWSSLVLDGESYHRLGELIAWRTTLWEGDKLLAQQRSFLW